ncbi:exodeoxyribonuclease VII large subunit [Brevibacterium ihuae]|uniref:exodeoxyribonuclease VII large subunit n=1 Tax=Brevibacterium ihuae TaxID=1631743 RepID=UPI000C7602D8|nr:exodeoxyribonuclease VII large subunit [Brevibacterium ihuae]
MAQRISGTPGTLGAQPAAERARTAAETTPDNPWPLSLLSRNIKAYIDRMSAVWIEGQVIELNRRGKASYLTLRDVDEEMSLPVQVWNSVLDRIDAPLFEGARVVVNVKADFWLKAGRLSMRANDIRPVGLGELLARLEKLRRQLGAEGLFAPELKRRLPFLPNRIGLITGRNSDAEKDVMRNAALRWPAVEFEVRNVAVQGPDAVPQVRAALAELDALPEVDVIVIARGGGSLEDLLPFSNESLVRAVAGASTPVVSAIGHEADRPILDEVADLRASTPTDAAKRIVPDIHEERMGLLQARASLDGALERLLHRESEALAAVRSRPVLAQPESMITIRARDVDALRARAWQSGNAAVVHGSAQIEHLRAQVRALSPRNTLARGYAVVQSADGTALRSSAEVAAGQDVDVRLASGGFSARVTDIHPEPVRHRAADPAPPHEETAHDR